MMKLKDVLKRWGSSSFFSWMGSFLSDSISLIKREYGLGKLRVTVDPYTSMCGTNGYHIVMGAQFSPMKDESLEKSERLLIMKGVLWHEIGHILFTPFSVLDIVASAFRSGSMWPTAPENMPKRLQEYMCKGSLEQKRAFAIYKELENCLEDGRIENILLTYLYSYRGFAKALLAAREYFRKKSLTGSVIAESIRTYREAPAPLTAMEAYRAATSAVLQLAKYGDIPEIEELAKDRAFAKTLRRIAPHIATAVDSVNDAPEFYTALNYVYCELADYFLDYLEALPDEEAVEEMLSSAEKALGEMGLSPLPSGCKGEIEEATAGAKKEVERKKAKAKAGKAEKSEEKEPADADDAASGADESAGSDEDDAGQGSPASDADPASDDLSDIADESPWADEPGSIVYEDEDDRESTGLDPEMTIAAEEAEAKASKADEEAIIEELRESTGIDYGDVNAGISWKIRRAKDVARDDDRYLSYDKYIEVGRLAAKKIKPFFDPIRKTVYEKDRYSGPRIVSSKLSNPSLRHFAKKASMPKSPSLSVAILVDESGSMHGPNIEAAKAAAIALFEMCRELDISYGVFGHTCHGTQVEMTNYCMFESKDPMDKFRLLKICAQADNRDGAALRYTADVLSKEETDRRLLIIISDGQPYAPGYSGSLARKDIQQVIKDYEYKGVQFVAAAIDQDKAAIENIYGPERFLDITDLSQLPTKLAEIVRRCTQS